MYVLCSRVTARVVLSSTLAAFVFAASSGTALGVTLTGHWRFDGNLQDSVGGNHGTPIDNPVVGTTNGMIGGAVEFDGSADGVRIPSIVIPAATGTHSPFSIAWWDFSSGTSNEGYMVASGSPTGFENLFLRRAGGNPNIYNGGLTQTGGMTGFGGSGVFARNEWHHHVVTLDENGNGSWYIDGLLELTDNDTNLNGLDADLILGRREGDTQRDFLGLIDDLQIYDGPLSPEQVAFLFDNPGTAILPIPEPSSLLLGMLALSGGALVRRRGRGPVQQS